MDKKDVVILGNGLLGSQLHEMTGWSLLSREDDGFDITKPEHYNTFFQTSYHGVAWATTWKVIVNCIAHTDTYGTDKQPHWDINYKAVVDLANYCEKHNIKLVHISTDYVYSNSVSNASEEDVPVHCRNWYGYTKLLGDAYVQLNPKNLVIRSTHKEKPFNHLYGWINQIGNFDYVDMMASRMIDLIEADVSGVYNVGGWMTSMYNLARATRPSVLPSTDLIHETTPTDVTMDLTKMKKIVR